MRREPEPTTAPRLPRALLSADVACAAAPHLFFEPDHPESDAARRLREQGAAVLCTDCPVRQVCFDYAVRVRPEHGIWAGHTPAGIAAFGDGAGEVA